MSETEISYRPKILTEFPLLFVGILFVLGTPYVFYLLLSKLIQESFSLANCAPIAVGFFIICFLDFIFFYLNAPILSLRISLLSKSIAIRCMLFEYFDKTAGKMRYAKSLEILFKEINEINYNKGSFFNRSDRTGIEIITESKHLVFPDIKHSKELLLELSEYVGAGKFNEEAKKLMEV